MSSFVYKYVHDGEIIYIGKTDVSLDSRLKAHGKPGDNIKEEYWEDINNSTIYYAECANKNMSDVIESALINKYHPKCNVAKQNLWEGLQFIEPIWTVYQRDNNTNKTISKLEKQIRQYQKELERKDIRIAILEAKLIDKEREQIINVKKTSNELNNYYDYEYSYPKTINFSNQKAQTFEEICNEYKNGWHGVYVSKSYDLNNELEFVKYIYTSGHCLDFDYQGYNYKRVRGTIYYSRDDKTMHYWDTLRVWNAKGSRKFYLGNKKEIKL